MTKLNRMEYSVLVEALRRRCRFHENRFPITEQWTGLGSASSYKQAVDHGYMVIATSPNPRHDTWWKLTEKGARIISYWIASGYGYERVEAQDFPPAQIPDEVVL